MELNNVPFFFFSHLCPLVLVLIAISDVQVSDQTVFASNNSKRGDGNIIANSGDMLNSSDITQTSKHVKHITQ